MSISEISIRRPVATSMFYIGVLILGIVSILQLPVNLLPNLSYPILTIRTAYTDIPPTEIEKLITIPIEEVVGTVPRVRRLTSISREGISLVTLQFLWGTNMDIAALNIREKLDNLRWVLPREAGRPTILRLDPRSQPMMSLSVRGDDYIHLKEFVRNIIKRRLEQIHGVALATVTGGLEREIHIDVNRQQLTALGLSIDQVAQALDNANKNLPGGTIRKGRYRYALRTLGEFQSISEIGDVVIAHEKNGAVIPLRKMAKITNGFKERRSITRYNGQESIGVLITKEAGANSVAVSKRIQSVLGQLRNEFPKVRISVVSNDAIFISSAISNVLQSLILGGILAFLVLFFFMHDLRNPVNIATAIPISVLATFALMYFSHVSLNMISLGGLALGVGMLVDNSIVVLENIFRHQQMGEDPISAGTRGSREVALAVTASTLTTVSVFFPIIYVKGIAGQLFRDQSLTVTFSLLSSLLVSLTLLPMLAVRFSRSPLPKIAPQKVENARIYASLFEKKNKRLPFSLSMIRNACQFILVWLIVRPLHFGYGKTKSIGRHLLHFISRMMNRLLRPVFDIFDRSYAAISAAHEKWLEWALANRRKILLTTLLALALTALLGSTIDRRLMPKIRQDKFTVRVKLAPGASLEATSAFAAQVEKILLSFPDVQTVFSQIGMTANQANVLLKESDRNLARMEVQLRKKHAAPEAIMADLERKLPPEERGKIAFERDNSILSQFLGTTRSDVAIKIAGENLDELTVLLRRVREKITRIPGLTNVHSSFEKTRPQIQISIDPNAAGRFGLSSAQIAAFVRNQMHGKIATYFKDFDRKIEILVRPEVDERNDLSDLMNAEIRVNEALIPIRQVIRAKMIQAPVEIHRENQTRELILYGSIRGQKVSRVIRKVVDQVKTIHAPANYRITVAGERKEIHRSFRSLILVFILAAALVYMVLAAQFESLVYPFVISFAVPLSFIGVVLALLLTGQSFNIMSLIGIVVLVGIVVNDAIVEVDFINQERRQGASLHASIVEAGKKRLRPIVMTTITTVFGLLPMAIGMGSGSALRRPLAIVVIGGLLASTFLTLIVIPVVYDVFSKK